MYLVRRLSPAQLNFNVALEMWYDGCVPDLLSAYKGFKLQEVKLEIRC